MKKIPERQKEVNKNIYIYKTFNIVENNHWAPSSGSDDFVTSSTSKEIDALLQGMEF